MNFRSIMINLVVIIFFYKSGMFQNNLCHKLLKMLSEFYFIFKHFSRGNNSRTVERIRVTIKLDNLYTCNPQTFISDRLMNEKCQSLLKLFNPQTSVFDRIYE